MESEARGRNEALFREVNERIETVSKGVPPDEELMGFLCECDNTACTEKVSATRAEYEAVRAVSTHFIVLAGHEDPDVEHVVQRNEHFLVVEKEGGAAREAEKSDPRDT